MVPLFVFNIRFPFTEWTNLATATLSFRRMRNLILIFKRNSETKPIIILKESYKTPVRDGGIKKVVPFDTTSYHTLNEN